MKMRLILDANELFACIIAKGKGLQSKTLDILFSGKVELFAPHRLLVELRKNREEIMTKSGFSPEDFEDFVDIAKIKVKFFRLDDFVDKLSEAEKLSPHVKDLEYFALALKLGCDAWSEEEAWKNQSRIRVFNTRELAEKMGL